MTIILLIILLFYLVVLGVNFLISWFELLTSAILQVLVRYLTLKFFIYFYSVVTYSWCIYYPLLSFSYLLRSYRSLMA